MKRELTDTELKRKIKICKKFGASYFQKLVFKTEKLKFKILKKIPNYTKKYESFCDRRCRQELRHAKTEQEKRVIVNYYREQKLLARREMVTEKNRNYHIDKNRPLEAIKYLEWNKKVHQNGLIKNAIVLLAATTLVISGVSLAIPLVILEGFSTFINFQCVNIQNYNLYRLKRREKRLKVQEQKNATQSIKEYGEAAKVIEKSLSEKAIKTDNPAAIPSIEEVINNIQNKEQLIQFRKMIKQTQAERNVQATFAVREGGKKYGN